MIQRIVHALTHTHREFDKPGVAHISTCFSKITKRMDCGIEVYWQDADVRDIVLRNVSPDEFRLLSTATDCWHMFAIINDIINARLELSRNRNGM